MAVINPTKILAKFNADPEGSYKRFRELYEELLEVTGEMHRLRRGNPRIGPVYTAVNRYRELNAMISDEFGVHFEDPGAEMLYLSANPEAFGRLLTNIVK